MSKRPIIGLTPDIGMTQAKPGRPALPRYELKQAYCDAVLAAGGTPLVLPYVDDIEAISQLTSLCSGIVITGGAFDIPPELYGEAAHEKLGTLHPARTHFERLVLKEALARDLPLLGVCGGMQLLAVALEGTLYQDIASELPQAMEHEQPNDVREAGHTVRVVPDSLLGRAVGRLEIGVNSTHHQAIAKPGWATVSARAPDGVIEAIEYDARKFVLGVQWHPELMKGDEQAAIYRAFVRAASGES